MRNELAIAGMVWAAILLLVTVIYVLGYIPGSCLNMVEYSGEIKGQWIMNDMLYIRYKVESCKPISICENIYCEIQGIPNEMCKANDFDTIYFQKENNRLIFLDDGDYIAVRWCEIPGIGYRIREIREI